MSYGTSASSLSELYTYIIQHYLSATPPADPTLADCLLALGAAFSGHVGAGTVTSVSVVTANGMAGTVSNPTLTPAITLSTTVNGIVKANGTNFAAAVSGTDYLTPTGNGSALTGLTVGQVSGAAPTASPTFTGTVTIPNGAVLGTPTSITLTNGTGLPESGVTNLTTDLAAKAPLASPTFTGTPAAPTAAIATNTTQLATTAFVQAGAPVNVLTTAFTSNAYTLAIGDFMSAQQAGNGSTAATVTVPTNASVAFPVGTVITFTQTASGKIQIAAAGGVTIISSVSGGFVSGTTGCRTTNSTIGLLKTATNSWTLSGDAA